MSGEIRAGRVSGSDGAFGVRLDPFESRVQLSAGGFDLAFQPGSLLPEGKQRQVFTTNSDRTFWTAPQGVTHIFAKVWGAGGGGGHYGGWTHGSHGGGGGFSFGIIPVTPGEVLSFEVSRGGFNVPGATRAPYGGGAAIGGGDNQYAAGGGGYSGVFRGSVPLLVAGAGGGGGSVSGDHGWCSGGAGGGLQGLRGESARNGTSWAGGGGTQAAGGQGGNGGSTLGLAGSYLSGGSVNGSVYGGGGGGGYYGGGAGSYGSSTMAGGGGGSGFVAEDVLLGGTFCGKGRYPAGVKDPDYPGSAPAAQSSVGFGGVQNTRGGDGHIVIYY